MKNNLLILAAVIVAVVLGGFFWWQSQKPAPAENLQLKTPSQPAETGEVPSSAQIQEFVVEGTEFAFSPNGIQVKAGVPVRITFANKGRMPHNLAIPDLGVTTRTIGSGQQDVIQFTAGAPGEFEIVCTVPGHKENGMVGSLIVE